MDKEKEPQPKGKLLRFKGKEGEDAGMPEVRMTGQAEPFIKLILAKSCTRYGSTNSAAEEIEAASNRPLVYSTIYADYGNLSGIVFSLEGSPPRGIIIATPISWTEKEPDGWAVVDVMNVGTIVDSGLQKAINDFINEKNIPLERSLDQEAQQLRQEADPDEREPEKPAE